MTNGIPPTKFQASTSNIQRSSKVQASSTQPGRILELGLWSLFGCWMLRLGISCSLVLLCSCQSAESKRKHSLSTLQIRLQADHSAPDRTELISVSRSHAMTMRVEKAPFLTEVFVTRAEVINDT